jgi:hypothetical protein
VLRLTAAPAGASGRPLVAVDPDFDLCRDTASAAPPPKTPGAVAGKVSRDFHLGLAGRLAGTRREGEAVGRLLG